MTAEAGGTGQAGGPSPQQEQNRQFADLGPRVLSGIALVVVALGTAVIGGRPFAALWWLAAVSVLWEWQRMIGGPRLTGRLLAGGAAVTIAAVLAETLLVWPALALLVLGSGLAALLAERDRRTWAAAGVAYAGALVLAVDLLRQSFPFGFEAIAWLFAVVWGTDVMAYVGGRVIGGPKLAPRWSPKKTWAGFLVGIGCGSLAGLAVAPAQGRYGIYLGLGLLAGALAQFGDLFESMMKRRFGVKDSSHLIPGHGGVMDRLDGFWAAAVGAALLGVARFGVTMPGAGLFIW